MMQTKKKTNCQLSFKERQIFISKLIKIQNMANEVLLDYIKSLESDLPFYSKSLDLDIINDFYNELLDFYSLHIIERSKSLSRG